MPDLRVVNALVFDGHGAELVAGRIEASDGIITAVVADDRDGSRGTASGSDRGHDGLGPAADQLVVDAQGAVVTPGLIDAHFHAYGIGLSLLDIESTPMSYVAVRATQRLTAALRRGFTTVRDVAGGDAGLARAVAEARFPSPRYLFTGPALSQTGGHGDPHPGTAHLLACCSHMTEVVDGVDPLRLAVRRRLRSGAHAIKLMTSGGVVSPTDPIRNPQYSAQEIAAVCDEATRRGTYVTAHAYSSEAVLHSISNGVRCIEHGNLLDRPAVEAMAEATASLVPTLATYDAMDRRGADLGLSPTAQAKNREVLASGQQAIQLAQAAGVTIGFGTDLMGALEDEQLQGLRLQAEAQGVLGTLRAATTGNASILGHPTIGRIAPGAAADLVILAGNPFEDASVLWSTRRTVIAAGRLVS